MTMGRVAFLQKLRRDLRAGRYQPSPCRRKWIPKPGKPGHFRRAGCDHVFVERLWRSVKFEEVYLHAYESVTAARNGIGRSMDFFNTRRATALDRQTPDTVYFGSPPLAAAA